MSRTAPAADRMQDGEWIIDGQPIEDAGLRRRIEQALDSLCEACTDVPARQPGDSLSYASAESVLDAYLHRVGQELETEQSGPRLKALIAHATVLASLRREVGDANLAHRSRRITMVQDAFARLRDISSVDGILQAIPAEVLRMGFSRAFISRVRDSKWIPEVVLVDGDPEWAAEILRAGREGEQDLDYMLLETEMVRRRIPMLVRDVQEEPRTHRPIADSSLSRSYVAAPLMPEGRVIGFIHADCYTARRHVDEFDRDLLWLFAEGAGYAFERTVLKERLRDLRDQAAKLTGVIGDVINQAVGADIEVARLERDASGTVTGTAPPAPMTSARIEPGAQITALLTRREVEIAQLMVTGATNAEIARRLVVAEGTVKTHVSHILRKLRAANRAQAVSTYMRLSQQHASSYPEGG